MIALLTSVPHSGAATPRTSPEASDLFLFAASVFAVWIVRRSLRRRFGNKRADD